VSGQGTLRARTVAGRLLVFAVLLVLLDAVTGRVLDALRPSVGKGQLVGQVNSTIQARADVLVLGASTALHHYDDRRLSERLGLRVYNGGVDGRAILFARGELSLAGAVHRPRLVVLDLSYSPQDRADAQLLAPYYGHDRTVDEVLNSDWRNRVKLVSRAYRYNQLALPILSHLGTPMTSGFAPLDGSLPADLPREGGPQRPDRSFGPWFGVELRRLVGEARALGARMVFVESPTWGNPVPPVVAAEYERVAREMRVPFFRLTPDHYPEFANATLYRDRSHLNRQGAEIFSRLVGDSLATVLAAPAPAAPPVAR
jgi:hypothetical protein